MELSKLKKTIMLKDCYIEMDEVKNNPKSIPLHLPNSHILLMEANTPEEAHGWIQALEESIRILHKMYGTTNCNMQSKKFRRINVTEQCEGLRSNDVHLTLEKNREVLKNLVVTITVIAMDLMLLQFAVISLYIDLFQIRPLYEFVEKCFAISFFT
jgi:hypothetical protein